MKNGFFTAPRRKKRKTFDANHFDKQYKAVDWGAAQDAISRAERECKDDKTAYEYPTDKTNNLRTKKTHGGGRQELAEARFRGNHKIRKEYIDYITQNIETRRSVSYNCIIVATRIETIIHRVHANVSVQIIEAKVSYSTYLEEKKESENN